MVNPLKKIFLSIGVIALLLLSQPVFGQGFYSYNVHFIVREYAPDVVLVADGHTFSLGDLAPGEYTKKIRLSEQFADTISVEIRSGGRLLGEVQPVVVIPKRVSSQYNFKSQFRAKENPEGTFSITDSSTELTFKSGGLEPSVYSIHPSTADIAIAPGLSENARKKLLQIPSVFRINGDAARAVLFANGSIFDVLKTSTDVLDVFYKKEGLTNYQDAVGFDRNFITDTFTNLTKDDNAYAIVVKLENNLPVLYLFNLDGTLKQVLKSGGDNFYLAYGTVEKDGEKVLAIVVSSLRITKNNFVTTTGGSLIVSENSENKLFSPGSLKIGGSASVFGGLGIVSVVLAQGSAFGQAVFFEEGEGEVTPPPQSQDNLIDPPCTEVTAGETTTAGIPGVTTTGGETKKKGKTTGFGVSGDATFTEELGTIGSGKSETTVSGFITGGVDDDGGFGVVGFQLGKGGELSTVTKIPDGPTARYDNQQDAMDAIDEYLREGSKQSCPPPATPPIVEEEKSFIERWRQIFTGEEKTTVTPTSDNKLLRSPELLFVPLDVNYSPLNYSAPTLYEQTTSFLQTTFPTFFNFLR